MAARDRAENREWFPTVTSLVILTLPATSDRFATVAVIDYWNSVLACPKCRTCVIPSWPRQASLCSTTLASGEIRHTPHLSATFEPAEEAPPADKASSSNRCPFPIPHTALAANTLHIPSRRTRKLSTGGCIPCCPSGPPSCTPYCWYAQRGRSRSQARGLSRNPPCPLYEAPTVVASASCHTRATTTRYPHQHV